MAFNVKKIFAEAESISKISTKKEYEKKMHMFLSERYAYLSEMTTASDVAAASKIFCDDVHNEFKKFGKVRTGTLMTLNLFLIYYIFPAILKNEGERATAICDALKDTWNSRFKCNIDYSDFDSLTEGFQTKIFGIPVEKN